MGNSSETKGVTAGQSPPDPSPLSGSENIDNEPSQSDGSSNGDISSKSSSLIRTTDNPAWGPESYGGPKDVEAEEEPPSKGRREDRRRLKQRERRQQWRHKEREKKAEAEEEVRLKILALALALGRPASLPAAISTAHIEEPATYQPTKGHRPSPQERTLSFFINLFRYDTRPTDWDLVCVELGEYEVFPNRQLVLPLSRLSALVWNVEYEARRLTTFSSKDVVEVEQYLLRKERELMYYRKHLKNWKLIWGSWRKYLGELDESAVRHTVKSLFYGNKVLSRVTAQLEVQRQELAQQIQRKHYVLAKQ